MHPLQQAFRDALSAQREAEAALANVQAERTTANEEITELETEIEATRTTLKNAVTEHEIKTTKRKYALLVGERDVAGIRLEGFDSRIELAEKNLEKAERAANRAKADLCVAIANEIERDVLALARKVGPLVAARKQLSRLASRAMTHAVGHLCDPMGDATSVPGAETPFARSLRELLSASTTSSITTDDLLSWPLTDEPKAAE